MPKYLVQGSYTDQGLKGLMKVGGSKRRAMVEQLAKDLVAGPAVRIDEICETVHHP